MVILHRLSCTIEQVTQNGYAHTCTNISRIYHKPVLSYTCHKCKGGKAAKTVWPCR